MRPRPALSLLTPALPLVLILAAACGRDGDEATTRAPARGDKTDATAPSIFTEPQAIQILLSIDRARLSTAQAVGAKSENEMVLQFAQVMKADHAAMSALLDTLLSKTGQTPAENTISKQFTDAAQLFAFELAQRDTGINNSYLAKEVRDHEQALQLLQGALIPSARSPEVKAMLEQLVPAYHAHLQRAKEILAARAAGRAMTTIARSPSSQPGAPSGNSGQPSSTPENSPRPSSDSAPIGEPVPSRDPAPEAAPTPKLLGRPIGN